MHVESGQGCSLQETGYPEQPGTEATPIVEGLPGEVMASSHRGQDPKTEYPGICRRGQEGGAPRTCAPGSRPSRCLGERPLLSCFMIGVAQKSPGSPSANSVFIVGKRIYFQSSFNESKRLREPEA